MKLLIYTHDLSCNGASKHLCRILPYLNKTFDTILVINTQVGSNYLFSLLPKTLKRPLLQKPATSTELQQATAGHMFIKTPNMLKASNKLASIIRQYKPNIVLSVGSMSSGTALLAKKLISVPRTVSKKASIANKVSQSKFVCLAQQHLSKQTAATTSVQERYFYKALLKFYKSADLIITASEGIAIDLAKANSGLVSKIKTVHNAGFDEDCDRLAAKPTGEKIFDKRAAADKQAMKRVEKRKEQFDKTSEKLMRSPQLEFGIEFPDISIITACCNFSPRKNISLLIKAFAKIHEKIRRARLVIIGAPKQTTLLSKHTVAGKELATLKKLISQLKLESFVDLLPFHNNPYKYLSKSDVCVLPSLYECFGTILTEAMAVGCPVISCNCAAGPNEIIEDNKNGFLVPVGNVDILAQNIFLLLGRKSLREKFSAAGLERVKMFAPHKSAEETIKLLQSLQR